MSTVSTSPALAELGWDDEWAAELSLLADPCLQPGRVSRIDRGAMTILTATGPQRADSGRGAAVAVGDWVAVSAGPGSGRCSVVALLPRRFALRRPTQGAGSHEQVVAANIDAVLLVDAVDGPLGPGQLERHLTLAWRSGATPHLVITKADLASPERVSERIVVLERVAPGVAVHVVSTESGQGVDDLARQLGPGRTAALLGLSGAGKSTLVNHLAEAEVLATGDVRRNGQGRHTTTHRQLVALPSGGLIIDTPGMRVLSIEAAGDGIEPAFADIEELVTQCHFTNCTHANEHDCAVNAAVDDGSLNTDRVASWFRLREQVPSAARAAARARVQIRKRRKATAKANRRALGNSEPRPMPEPPDRPAPRSARS